MAKKSEETPECCGFSKVNRQGQMTIPVEARKALGMDPDTRLMVFADKPKRRLLVTVAPTDSDLLDLATPEL